MPAKQAERALHPDLPTIRSRDLKETTKQVLVALSAGRCAFNGCNRFLFEHGLTKTTGYFGNFAHIRAFSPGGARADAQQGEWINDADNLVLLCPECHKLVDDDAKRFTVEMLRSWKREHEERVALLLNLPRENEAAMIEIWTNVSNPPVVRGPGALIAALLPLYPSKRHAYLIDFAGKNLSDITLIAAAKEQIDNEVARLFAASGDRPRHVAVFGITNMPLLVYLGSKLGDRIKVHLFQAHRDTSDWRWKDEDASCAYEASCVREGTEKSRVAIVVALSGPVDLGTLPSQIDATYSLYQLTLKTPEPGLGFLRTRADLERFCEAYRALLAQLRAQHGVLDRVELFPAVPVPIAVAIGKDRLPKVDPLLGVYDYDKQHGGWRHMLDVP